MSSDRRVVDSIDWDRAARGWSATPTGCARTGCRVSLWMLELSRCSRRARPRARRRAGRHRLSRRRADPAGGTLISSDSSAAMLALAKRAPPRSTSTTSSSPSSARVDRPADRQRRRDPLPLGADAERRSGRGAAGLAPRAAPGRPRRARGLGRAGRESLDDDPERGARGRSVTPRRRTAAVPACSRCATGTARWAARRRRLSRALSRAGRYQAPLRVGTGVDRGDHRRLGDVRGGVARADDGERRQALDEIARRVVPFTAPDGALASRQLAVRARARLS